MKTFTALAVLAMCTAAPAFAADTTVVTTTSQPAVVHHVYHHRHAVAPVAVVTTPATTTVTSTQSNTYRVVTPLTPEDVALRRRMQTRIEDQIKRTDLDGDHLISYDEYKYGDQKLHEDNMDIKTSFQTIDKNNDGKLSSQEIMDARWAAAQHLTVVAPASGSVTSTTQTVYTRD